MPIEAMVPTLAFPQKKKYKKKAYKAKPFFSTANINNLSATSHNQINKE
jgi:hypothetical protein